MKEINGNFLRSFLKGSKSLYKKSDILALGVIPRFEELSRKNILETILEDCNRTKVFIKN
jgi:hypothetical protein